MLWAFGTARSSKLSFRPRSRLYHLSPQKFFPSFEVLLIYTKAYFFREKNIAKG